MNKELKQAMNDAIRSGIAIDFESEVQFGYEQVNMTYPHLVPTVGFRLVPSEELRRVADLIRKAEGKELCDEYAFYLGINNYTPSKLDTCIEFVTVTDYGEQDRIDLLVDEQADVFGIINKLCIEKLGKSCEELLAEAEYELTHPKLPKGISYITAAELKEMFDGVEEGHYEPRGLFILDPNETVDKSSWTAIDNEYGNAWVEDFDTLVEACHWLVRDDGDNVDDEELDDGIGLSANASPELAKFARILAAYIEADSEDVERAYALERAFGFGLNKSDLHSLGLDWLMDD